MCDQRVKPIAEWRAGVLAKGEKLLRATNDNNVWRVKFAEVLKGHDS